jgi:membrane protease YdiL (CAAX protease family)
VQFTAAKGIGFWPAAILLSAYFGFSHIGRATETWLGALNAGVGGLVLCLFLKRTGDLWLSDRVSHHVQLGPDLFLRRGRRAV